MNDNTILWLSTDFWRSRYGSGGAILLFFLLMFVFIYSSHIPPEPLAMRDAYLYWLSDIWVYILADKWPDFVLGFTHHIVNPGF